MQRILTTIKTVLLVAAIAIAWLLVTTVFVLAVETFANEPRQLQVGGVVVLLSIAAFLVRRTLRAGGLWTRTAPKKQKQRRAAGKRGLDEVYDDGFGEARRDYRVLADDLPTSRKWRGEDTVTVADIVLERRLAYTSKKKREACPGTITLRSKVAKDGEVFDQTLDFWPRYTDLMPGGRRGFLLWLADGARTEEVSLSYAFIYLYGLEQRAVGDGRDLERIREELLRLHGLFGTSRSYHQSAGGLLGMVHALDETADPGPSLHRLTETHPGKVPLPFLWAVSTRWPENRWPADYVLEVLRHHASNTIVQKRAWEQFADLFAQRFAEEYRDGFVPRRNAKVRSAPYRWAANTGTKHVEYPYLDATALGTQWNKLERLWKDVTAELRPYAIAAGRKTLSEGELYERLPADLQTGDHPEQRAWQSWFDEAADDQELALTTWGHLAELSASITTKKGKVSPAETRQAAALCDSMGLAMEPDPRVGRGRSRPLDEPVLIYRPAAGVATPPSDLHDALSLVIELCVGVAAADGEVSDTEIDAIITQVDRREELDEAQRERLLACVTYFHRVGAGLRRATKARLARVPTEVRTGLAHLVVLVALADGVLTDGEEKALQKVYRGLDLPADELDEILRPHRPAPAVEVEEPEDVPEPEPDRIAIDWERVADLTADTRDVQAMLHEALAAAEGEEAPVEPEPEPEPEVAIDTLGLDDRAAPLLAWIRTLSADTIPASDWEDQCRAHGLMAEMAVDLVNEWSDEALGDYLVEADGDDTYTLNRDLL